ncbi:MAG: ketose-bisphosphate aldolase [Luteitalea sp.]|nr:ketose-bisphosphate aldolase [Luteitalea sp.]
MPLVTTHEIVDSARRAGGGAVAFNVITLEHAEAIVAGAEQANAPVILQISQNAVRFHQSRLEPIAAATAAVARAAEVPVSLHLDHIDDDALLRRAADGHFSSVMYDASALDYNANVAATKAAAEWAHDNGLWVEAELGEVGGKGGAHAPGVRTRPDEARAFVAATGVDALAVAVGSSHAMTSRIARLDHALIGELRAAVPVPLVLHGSSGVADDELVRAVAGGLVKINIGTALNIAFTGAVREYLVADPTVVDPRKYIDPGREAMTATVAQILSLLHNIGARG